MHSKKLAAVALAAAALTMSPHLTTSSEAHHRSSDRWERRYDHHHSRWVNRTDRRLALHRRWHRWHTSRGGRTPVGHRAGPSLRVESTAYCLTGYMASGHRAHTGAAAMNGVPLGTRFRVASGPLRGETLVVRDRIGHGTDFDVALPGRCGAAHRYGRRTINIRRR